MNPWISESWPPSFFENNFQVSLFVLISYIPSTLVLKNANKAVTDLGDLQTSDEQRTRYF
jgi:hypothetical protein